jgi:hypothetical protein
MLRLIVVLAAALVLLFFAYNVWPPLAATRLASALEPKFMALASACQYPSTLFLGDGRLLCVADLHPTEAEEADPPSSQTRPSSMRMTMTIRMRPMTPTPP